MHTDRSRLRPRGVLVWASLACLFALALLLHGDFNLYVHRPGERMLKDQATFPQRLVYSIVLGSIYAAIAAYVLYYLPPYFVHAGSRCNNCDYPIDGLTSARCPECGAPLKETERGTPE